MHAQRKALRAPVAFDGSAFLPDGATVLLDGDTITGVEPFGYAVPADWPVREYSGTLLPGLVDAHVHLVSDASAGSLERAGATSDHELDAVITQSLRQQVAAGVTTVRDLGDTRYRTLSHRDRAVPGTPRIVAAGPPFTIPDGHCHYLGGLVDGREAIRHALRDHVDRGVDVVKVMASGGMITVGTDVFGVQFTADDLRLLVDLVHDEGLAVLAHAHSLAGIEHALDAGVDGIEHFTGITSSGVQLPDALLERVAAMGVTVDPTFGSDEAVLAALTGPPPRIVQVMAGLGLDVKGLFAQRLIGVARMREHGIRVVSGVDAGAAPPKAHGNAWRAVNDLVQAGFPVAEALSTATAVAAASCGLAAVTGSLSPGLAADVLAAAGDLRVEPEALGRPVAVLARGVDVVV